jgi:hypothetical protein
VALQPASPYRTPFESKLCDETPQWESDSRTRRRARIEAWRHYYDHRLPHSSLGALTRIEFANLLRKHYSLRQGNPAKYIYQQTYQIGAKPRAFTAGKSWTEFAPNYKLREQGSNVDLPKIVGNFIDRRRAVQAKRTGLDTRGKMPANRRFVF